MNLEYWRNYYLYGETGEVAEKVRKRIERLEGVDWVVFNPVTYERKQLNEIVNNLFPSIAKQ
jgi:NTP pyrophosphatase (non-canonical NTP hydrolase)